MTPRFRRLLKFAPGFLINPEGDGERILFSLGKLCDAFAEKCLRGLEARFPSRTVPSANALTAGDRGILRGRSESNAGLASRLIPWRNPRGHKVRGNAFESLLQIWHYWGGIYAATVDSHGLRHKIAAADSPNVNTMANPDTQPSWIGIPFGDSTSWTSNLMNVHWSEFWIILQPKASDNIIAQPDFGDPALWGGALGTPGYTLGQQNVKIEDVTAMRALFQELKWGPGNAQPEWVVIGLDPLARPNPIPDPNWLYWSKDSSGTRVESRKPASLAFSHGAAFFQNGTAPANIALPATVNQNDLLIWCESQNGGTFTAPPAGWTLIQTNMTGGTFFNQRILARMGVPGEGGGTVPYTPTGADDHAIRITRVTPPSEGWITTDVTQNFVELTTNTTSNGALTQPMPDNLEGRHRMVFVTFDYFDVSINVSSATYNELYDNANEINISLFETTKKQSGATVVASGGGPTFKTISWRFPYNLSWRFWSLDPMYNNTYAGDRGREWPNAATKIDGTGNHKGERADGTAAFGSITLPDGSTYAGTRARFPERVLFVDDGSIPK